ncbi:hypothetical protein ACFWAR_25520 [Streptomyces sp. NPDC059917]|uniref:hypothetical protein n=1 Tax=Streptomyces sp. NPDC059917 TaxID=3347002 RepID=UPI0036635F68
MTMKRTLPVSVSVVLTAIALASTTGAASAAPAAPGGKAPTDYLYMSLGDFEEAVSGQAPDIKAKIDRPDIHGVQVVVPWKALEGRKGEYKWSRLDDALTYLQGHGKKLFVQLQDRFFDVDDIKNANVPQYVKDAGGVAPTIDENPDVVTSTGAMAAQWKKDVRTDFQGLLKAMAAKFDGRLGGVNLPETSIEVDTKKDRTGYDSTSYIDAELENMAYGRKVFTKTPFVQYVNFLPDDDDHRRMKEMFDLARDKGIGIGGPDTLPDRDWQMKNSYKFLHAYKDVLPLVAMAVQEPDIGAKDPGTGLPYTRQRFTDFAGDYLGASCLFWTTEADWLREPAASAGPR